MINVTEALRNNRNEIKNPNGYLYSVILNSVNVEKTFTVLDAEPEYISGESLYAFK